MLETVKENLSAYGLDSRDKILLAISGGLDSCVLLEALRLLGFQPDLAHVNFQLRKEDANADQEFCRLLAKKHGFAFYSESFETQSYAEEQKLSIQMAARNLRYDFFERLDQHHNYQAILTAHHADDQIETVLFKLARGSGLEAIAGIRKKRQKYIRPMLDVFRVNIEDFAKEHSLQWREDSSNAETKYLRNAYRHKLIPFWEEIQPDLKTKLRESSQLLRQESKSLQALLLEKLKNHLVSKGETESLNYHELSDKPYFPDLLFLWLSRKGNWDWKAVNHLHLSRKGRFTENEDYRLYHGENCYVLQPIKEVIQIDEWIERDQSSFRDLEFSFVSAKDLEMDGKPEHLFLDADTLNFPLKLRNWQDGDRFQPLGMSGSKKLSDYWIDQKMAMAEKDRQLVLESSGEIVALIGHRIDHRHRIKNSTKTVYFVRLKK